MASPSERFQGEARFAEMSNATFDGPWEFRQDVAYALRQAREQGLTIGAASVAGSETTLGRTVGDGDGI